jgi:hypothetical protein
MAPIVIIQQAVKTNIWTINAFITANSLATTAYFEYGTTVALGLVTSTINVGSGGSSVNISQSLPTLVDNTTYYYRVNATNSAGNTISSILSFNSGDSAPFTPNLKVISSNPTVITIQNELQFGPTTYLSRDSVNNLVTFVENSSFLLTNQQYLLGNLGAENAEFININTVTLPTNAVPSTVTFASVPINKHARGEPLALVTYDTVEISYCATQNGVFTVLSSATILQINAGATFFQDTASRTTAFYRARFANSVTNATSPYSSPISVQALTPTTVGYLLNSIRNTLGISPNDLNLTDDFLIGALNEGRQIFDREIAAGKMKEWRQVFEYPIGMLAGSNYINLPNNIDYAETNRATLNARYSNNSVGSALPLTYIDKSDWNFATYQRRYSTVAVTAITNATTLVLANTGDFPSSGTVTAQAEDFTQVPIFISYTGNNVQTGTLTGVTGITRQVSFGSQIWAYQTQEYPRFYTVFDSKLYLDSYISLQMNGKNIFIDYYKQYTDVAAMTDVLPEHYRDIYKRYIQFAIKRRRDNSIGEEDPDYKRFLAAATSVFGNEYLGQMIRIT